MNVEQTTDELAYAHHMMGSQLAWLLLDKLNSGETNRDKLLEYAQEFLESGYVYGEDMISISDDVGMGNVEDWLVE